MAEKRISELLWERLTISEQQTYQSPANYQSGPKFTPKKKSKFATNRDSLAFRESPGKPGTKRYNRYLNTKFLKDGGVLKDQFTAIMDHDLYEKNERLVYQDGEMAYHWEPFRNISFDKQQEMIGHVEEDKETNKSRKKYLKTEKINQSFSLLQKNIREAFKKPFIQNCDIVTEIENRMIEFVSNPFVKTTEVELESGHHRLLLHGVGSYYSVFTKSKERHTAITIIITKLTNHTFTLYQGYTCASTGRRMTIIRKPKVMPPLPELSIVEYITNQQRKNKDPHRIRVASRSRSNSFQGIRIRC
ncbi:hypothetical protein SAMD00019534_075960 [Acytostelium subglobosum LB1]|uniref:hypothetical protein n=1 Tax=Acytostelium subglobosum LB1 TaxID=1410327 RepID=UPI000644DD58|nr:hypothetical protein SAMD00019534_075960 [Acytostelium subglobosum LB1]GAM24421.1 hypothetical protein SAMD00019534_075960 [Acytostelium subglobosum LB1]|eukprot:XP_012752747.1 hypothetical protein SAMD00019534_075960 [Acytostelium subglobosum LB1]